MGKQVEHRAIVEHVEGQCVDVVMSVQGACASCKAKSLCGSGEGQERRIAIHTPDAQNYAVGEEVIVAVERTMGMKAVAIAYIYPFLLMLSTLLVLLEAGAGEAVAGLSALGVTAVYFLVVYLLRNKIDREIVFTLRKF